MEVVRQSNSCEHYILGNLFVRGTLDHLGLWANFGQNSIHPIIILAIFETNAITFRWLLSKSIMTSRFPIQSAKLLKLLFGAHLKSMDCILCRVENCF